MFDVNLFTFGSQAGCIEVLHIDCPDEPIFAVEDLGDLTVFVSLWRVLSHRFVEQTDLTLLQVWRWFVPPLVGKELWKHHYFPPPPPGFIDFLDIALETNQRLIGSFGVHERRKSSLIPTE